MSEPDINSIIAGLTDDDFARLNDMAQQLFGNAPPSQPAQESNQASQQTSQQPHSEPQNPFGGIDPEMMAKIMKILPMLQGKGNDERTQLIAALKPLLSEARRKRADEALQLMRLMDALPLLGNMGLFN